MTFLETSFWSGVGVASYAYALYPLAIAAAARLRPARERPDASRPAEAVSVVVAAFNEEKGIARRVRELGLQLDGYAGGGELIVVSDGSTDETAERARAAAEQLRAELARPIPVRVLALEVNAGKAVALNAACAASSSPILILADARQTWAPDAIGRLVGRLADPAIGAVSGDLRLESEPGVMAGVGLYWRFEKWLRRSESRFRSMVSVTGAICALRRELYRPLPPGTLLDDVYWPLTIAMTGRRVVHEEGAVAYDRLPERARDEFRRKVRTLSGNFQLMARLPAALLPWRNRAWWQFISHRVLRLAVPWALLVALGSSALAGGPIYTAAFGLQVACYLVGLAGLRPAIARRSRLASAAGSFLVLNAAAWLGFWVWAAGRSTRSWSKVHYEKPLSGGAVQRS